MHPAYRITSGETLMGFSGVAGGHRPAAAAVGFGAAGRGSGPNSGMPRARHRAARAEGRSRGPCRSTGAIPACSPARPLLTQPTLGTETATSRRSGVGSKICWLPCDASASDMYITVGQRCPTCFHFHCTGGVPAAQRQLAAAAAGFDRPASRQRQGLRGEQAAARREGEPHAAAARREVSGARLEAP